MSDEPSPSLGIVNDDLTITFKRDLGCCYHVQIIVDAGRREVTCKKCKKLLDPFEALGHLAREAQSLVDERKQLREDVIRWRAQEADAKRMRNNAMAALKRKESPEAELLRALVEENRYARCVLDTPCGRCAVCRMRSVLGRTEP